MMRARAAAWLGVLVACGSPELDSPQLADAAAENPVTTTSPSADGAAAPWMPLAPDAVFHGLEREDWALAWAKSVTALDDCDHNPGFDKDGSDCATSQDPDSDIFVLHLGLGRVTKRTRCEVPAGKAILVPLFGVIVDRIGSYPGPDTPEHELARIASEAVASSRDLTLKINGRSMGDLRRWSVDALDFAYDLPVKENIYTCSGLTGVQPHVSPAYLGGIFVLLSPPPPGQHQLEYGAVITFDGHDIASFVTTSFRVTSE